MEKSFNPEQKTSTQESLMGLSETIGDSVEYYVSGGLAAAVLTNSELQREYSDIDIVAPESAIENLHNVLSEAGYKFWDERRVHENREDLLGEHGHHEYGAIDNRGMRIGIYTFETLPDGKIVMRNHFGIKNNNGQIENKIEEIIFPHEIKKEDLFSPNRTNYKDASIPTVTAEQIYLRKMNSNRLKDMQDLQKLEQVVDKEKISRLTELAKKIEKKILNDDADRL